MGNGERARINAAAGTTRSPGFKRAGRLFLWGGEIAVIEKQVPPLRCASVGMTAWMVVALMVVEGKQISPLRNDNCVFE